MGWCKAAWREAELLFSLQNSIFGRLPQHLADDYNYLFIFIPLSSYV